MRRFLRYRGNVEDNVLALEEDVGSALEAVTDSAQQNVTQVVEPVEAAVSEN